MKKQLTYTVIGVLLLALIVVGSTYAFFLLTVSSNNPITTNSSNFEVLYTKGDSFDGAINMVSRKEDGYSRSVKIKVAEDSVNVKLNLYLEIEQISPELSIDGFIWEVYGYDKTDKQVYSNQGTFKNYSSQTGHNIIDLVDYDYTVTKDETTFVVYLWLDGNLADNNVVGSTFRGHIGAKSENFTGIPK